MFAFLEYKLLALAIGMALFEGGRAERQTALALALHAVLYLAVVLLPDGVVPGLVICSVHALLLAALVWLALRHRTRWLVLLCLFQALILACWIGYVIDAQLYMRVLRAVAFVAGLFKSLGLGMAALRSWIGPPRLPPAA